MACLQHLWDQILFQKLPKRGIASHGVSLASQVLYVREAGRVEWVFPR